jgi:hypothetical protein
VPYTLIDVFTMPASGGVPKRVTCHPDPDRVVGWTPDGKRILFRSTRLSYSRFNQLYTVSTEGGLPEVLPLPMATFGAYSPDGKHMVYAPVDGGQFARLAPFSPPPWEASNPPSPFRVSDCVPVRGSKLILKPAAATACFSSFSSIRLHVADTDEEHVVRPVASEAGSDPRAFLPLDPIFAALHWR